MRTQAAILVLLVAFAFAEVRTAHSHGRRKFSCHARVLRTIFFVLLEPVQTNHAQDSSFLSQKLSIEGSFAIPLIALVFLFEGHSVLDVIDMCAFGIPHAHSKSPRRKNMP